MSKVCTWLRPARSIKTEQSTKWTSKRARCLNWLHAMHSFPWGYSMSLWWTYRDWKWESHLYMLYIATDILCSHCDLITLLYPSTKSKSCVKSNIMKRVNVVLNIKPSLCGINKGTWSEVTGLWNCFWQAYKNWKAHSQESYRGSQKKMFAMRSVHQTNSVWRSNPL